jgi:enoyl-CoA hydratase
VVTLNRPEALNALNSALFADLADFLDAVERDDSVRCLILTGSGDKAFAAGADIKEMADQTYAQMYTNNYFALGHDRITRFRKPIIAAVNGFALGGGCELAMLCDFIVASEKAKFGQPEINLGVAPGIGGSQRLTRLVGKAKAMDMVLTARMMDAAEAERAGLASRVFPHDTLMDEARKIAARRSRLAEPPGRHGQQGDGQRRARDDPDARASSSSAVCSTPCSPSRIRRRDGGLRREAEARVQGQLRPSVGE